MSKSLRHRRKTIREGKLDPAVQRQQWMRKPQTQTVPNKKAENRRTYCRKGSEDSGFVIYFSFCVDIYIGRVGIIWP